MSDETTQNPPIESKFRLVHIAARRPEQLIQGARPKLESKHTKKTRIALDEVSQSLVKWQLSSRGAPVAEEEGVAADPLPTTGD